MNPKEILAPEIVALTGIHLIGAKFIAGQLVTALESAGYVISKKPDDAFADDRLRRGATVF